LHLLARHTHVLERTVEDGVASLLLRPESQLTAYR
jgi:hypothetical protein